MKMEVTKENEMEVTMEMEMEMIMVMEIALVMEIKNGYGIVKGNVNGGVKANGKKWN